MAIININKEELEKYLEIKRKQIEMRPITGIGEIVAGISLFFSLLTTEIKGLSVLAVAIIEVFLILVGTIITIMGICDIVISIRSKQTKNDLFEGICELDVSRIHTVNIVIIKNSPQCGKYLLILNRAWKCPLFPSYKSTSQDYNIPDVIESIKESIVRDVGIQPKQITYLGDMPAHLKNCVGMNALYRYKFHFYRAEIEKPKLRLYCGFRYNGNRFIWRSLDQMYKNKNTKSKNDDVVCFVAQLEGMPFN